MAKIVTSIKDLIGDTPLLKLSDKIVPVGAADVYVKIESANIGGSTKDRVALNMIEVAEREGKLTLGDIIVEPTSGNTGVGLAMIAAVKGYKALFVMPDKVSIERRKLMKAYGAELILTPGAGGIKESIVKATEIATQPGYYMPLQFENIANPAVHAATTGPEILAAFDGESPDAFVATVGTGGTLTGVGKVLKEANPNTKVYAVEPTESPVLSGGVPSPHKIQGIGTGFIPKVLDTLIYDEVLHVTSEESFEMARKVALTEGLLVGMSSGAAIKGAIDVAIKLGSGKKVVTIAPDNGERYLSTALFPNEE